ncbi:MAG: choice-of-anchor J domain-containing protein [Bacteroidales bacterium]|nr:choice-of-anchor J domain-containing protein [Bacteroidales bacterium]
MLRNLFFFTVFLFITSLVHAQLVDEDFETTTPDSDVSLTDWTNSAEVGTRLWIGKEYNSNKYAQFSSYNSGEANEGWLITPSLTLDGTNEFSFEVNIGYWTHDALSVYISTDFDGTDIAGATWDDITSNFTIPQTPTGGYGTFDTAGTMTLTNYTGDAYIAFVYTGDDNAGETTTIQVDNVLVTSGSTGIQNLQENEFKVYPNPATSLLNINSGETIKNVVISNLTGQIVKVHQGNGKSKISVNIQELPSGIYIADMQNANGKISTFKFIKQ